jgi:hypothetical protein
MDSDRLERIGTIEFCKDYSPNFSRMIDLTILYPEIVSGNVTYYELITLCTLMRQFGFQTIVEFGTFNGRTTINLAANNINKADGRVYTVDLPKGVKSQLPLADGQHDPNDELGYIGLQFKLFQDCPVPIPCSITQIWSDTAQLKIHEWTNKADFLFIDASHSYENALNDSYTATHIVKPGGVIAWHDYNGWPGVTKAVNEFAKANPNLRLYWINDTSIAVGINVKG